MITTLRRSTASELYAMPDDGFRYELVKGELRRTSPSGSEHAVVIGKLTMRLGRHVEANDLGIYFGAEAGFKIASDPDTVQAPDLAFVSHGRVPESGIPKSFWTGAPDLAVEVVSPGGTYNEVNEKVKAWLDAGTRAVWIVNPRQRIVSVYRSMKDLAVLSEGDELDGGEVVPGFRCKVSEIFA